MSNNHVLEKNSKKVNLRSEKQINSLFKKITSFLMTVYVFFYLCIFPLCMNDKYFDILSFRFELFWKPTLAYAVLFAFVGIFYLISDILYNKAEIIHGLPKTLKSFKVSKTDIAMMALIVSFALSTVFSEYPYEAFWGDEGRSQGLFLWLFFLIAYFLVTRFYEFKKWHIWAYMCAASAVCIWGICNFFMITFNMFDDVDDIYRYMFVSSIGNINTYTAFTGILFGVAVAMFVNCRKTIESIFCYIVVLISSFAQIMGMSDNAIISTGFVLAVIPLILCTDYEKIARYFISASSYLLAMKLTYIMASSDIPTMNDPNPSVQITLAEKNSFYLLIGIFIILTIYYIWKSYNLKRHAELISAERKDGIKRFKNVWRALIVIAAVSVVVILILANSGWQKEALAPYENMLIFSDSWGTGRGLCWRLGMEFWCNDANLWMKLFGYGPDTYYIITMDRFMNIMQDAGYGMFDSAHNEYFEYFITVGIIGLITYVLLIYSALHRMIKKGNEYSKALAFGVIGYASQAVVNIAIPIVSPVYMILMYVGIVASRNKYVIKS